MRKSTVLLIGVCVISLALISPSFASFSSLDADAYTHLSDDTKTSEFGWDEQPFFSLEFDVDDLRTDRSLHTTILLFDPSGLLRDTQSRVTSSYPTDPLILCFSIDNWDLIKEVGTWNVKATYFNSLFKKDGKGGFGCTTVPFTVTPDPISSVLFMVGGIVLLVRRKLFV